MKTFVLVLTCLQIFGKDAVCAIFEKFAISKGKRFTTSFDSVTTLSRIDCCTRCVSTDGCLSVNFENSSKQCQLVSLPSSHLHNGTEVASGWDIYSIYVPGSLNCNFDVGSCGWTQDKTDDFDWTRIKGASPTSLTGPAKDHTSGNGYYFYIETSDPRIAGEKARFISPQQRPGGTQCFVFWYHMYGKDLGSLNVFLKTTPDLGSPIFTKQGMQGNQWNQAMVDISPTINFQIVIEGYRGASYSCDIAIDDVAMTSGSCGQDPDWLLVFRGTAGAGGNIYDAWVYGTYLVTGGDMDNCMRLDSTSCTGHYRNTVVESWSTIGITKVKFSVFKDGEEKQFIIFNGTGTNHENWFDAARILNSSWIDLKYKSFIHFSLRGFYQRTFHIAHVYEGCEGDRSYLQASVEAPGNDWPNPPCSYDYHTVYPTILYAENINSGGELFDSSSEVGEADFIAISISTA